MSNRSKPDHGIGFGSRKRKERDVASGKQTMPPPPTTPSSAAADGGGARKKNNNWLLAGYLAHEFLTGGTLLGQKWAPARAEANHVRRGGGGAAAPAAEVKRGGVGPMTPTTAVVPPQQKMYADVSNLLMKSSEGAHIEGIVNPTQLAKWLHSSTTV